MLFHNSTDFPLIERFLSLVALFSNYGYLLVLERWKNSETKYSQKKQAWKEKKNKVFVKFQPNQYLPYEQKW